MGVRLPKANTAFQTLTDAELGPKGQLIVNGLTASAVDYPTPPVDVVTLQGLVNNYNTALSVGTSADSREARAAMRSARLALKNALRNDNAYVNTIAATLIQGGASYADVQASIIGTGYDLSVDPSPIGPLPQAVIKKYSSPQPGQLYILLEKTDKAIGYQLLLGIVGTDPTTWKMLVFSSTRINVYGLARGANYTAQVAAFASNPARTFSEAITQIII